MVLHETHGELYSTIATQTPQMIAFAFLLAVLGQWGYG
jgi:hypothetical protein